MFSVQFLFFQSQYAFSLYSFTTYPFPLFMTPAAFPSSVSIWETVWAWGLPASLTMVSPKMRLLSSLSIYCGGLLIQRREGKYLASLDNAELDRAAKKALKKRNSRAKTRIAVLVALFNIAIWVLFKFTGILVTMFNRLFSTDYGLISLGIPLGISFYTLQAVSYVVDVSRGKCEAQKNFFKLALWLGFFPQMLQGVRAEINGGFYRKLSHGGLPFLL